MIMTIVNKNHCLHHWHIIHFYSIIAISKLLLYSYWWLNVSVKKCLYNAKLKWKEKCSQSIYTVYCQNLEYMPVVKCFQNFLYSSKFSSQKVFYATPFLRIFEFAKTTPTVAKLQCEIYQSSGYMEHKVAFLNICCFGPWFKAFEC